MEATMNTTKQALVDLDSWDDFPTSGNWMKAAQLVKSPDTAVCVGVEAVERDEKKRLIVTLEYPEKSGKFYDLELNKTNQKMMKTHCETPNKAVGRRFVLERCKQPNPQTKMMVDSILIVRVE